jgi:hypothetical protein
MNTLSSRGLGIRGWPQTKKPDSEKEMRRKKERGLC